MKKALYIITPILSILILIFTIVFTPFGSNSVIKPIANNIIAKKIENPKIEITKLDSTFGAIDMDLNTSNGVNANIAGDINYFRKDFDLSYKIKANELQVKNQKFLANIDISGQAVGKVKHFGVNGEGKAFDSGINYRFIINNKNVESINIHIDSATLSKMFASANMPPIADGLIFVDVNIPSLNLQNPSGKANIKITQGRINSALINKLYKVKLPNDEKFNVNVDAFVQKKSILSRGDINTTTVNLHIKKLIASLDFKAIKGFFDIKVPDLSRLNGITKQKLRGSFAGWGAFYLNEKKGKKQFVLNSKSFDGKLKLFYSNDKIKIDLKNISIAKILYKISMPKYVKSGTLNGAIYVPDLKRLNGTFALNSSGLLNPKMLNIKLPSYKYKISSKGSLKNGLLTAKKSSLVTNFATINLTNTKYNINKNSLNSNFSLNIKHLEALKKYINQDLQGAFSAYGDIAQNGAKISLNATSKSFGGILKVNYKNNFLKVNGKKIALNKILYMLKKPHYLNSGVANVVLKLNSFAPLNGSFGVISKGWVDNKTIKRLYDINLGNNFRYILNMKNAQIKNGIIYTKAQIDTSMATINLNKLTINSNNFSVKGDFNIDILDLAKLQPLTEQKLNGSLKTYGNFKFSQNSKFVTGIAKKFGGSINYILNNDDLTVDVAGVSIVGVTKMLSYPNFLDGIAKAHLTYNLKSQKGKYTLTLNDARFLNSNLVSALKTYAKFDLSKELFSNATIRGNIDKDIITFNLNTSSKRAKIVINNGKFNKKYKTIDTRISLTYNGNEYIVKLSGNINNPHIKPVFGGYIKQKAIDTILKKTGLKDKLKLDNNATKDVKEKAKEKIEEKVKDKVEKVIPKEVKEIFNNLKL